MKMKIEDMKPGTLFKKNSDEVAIKTKMMEINTVLGIEFYKCVCVYSKGYEQMQGSVYNIGKGCEYETVEEVSLKEVDYPEERSFTRKDMIELSQIVRQPVIDLYNDAIDKKEEGAEENDFCQAYIYDISQGNYEEANIKVREAFEKFIEEKWR